MGRAITPEIIIVWTWQISILQIAPSSIFYIDKISHWSDVLCRFFMGIYQYKAAPKLIK